MDEDLQKEDREDELKRLKMRIDDFLEANFEKIKDEFISQNLKQFDKFIIESYFDSIENTFKSLDILEKDLKLKDRIMMEVKQ